jgi:hypothetical protein
MTHQLREWLEAKAPYMAAGVALLAIITAIAAFVMAALCFCPFLATRRPEAFVYALMFLLAGYALVWFSDRLNTWATRQLR